MAAHSSGNDRPEPKYDLVMFWSKFIVLMLYVIRCCVVVDNTFCCIVEILGDQIWWFTSIVGEMAKDAMESFRPYETLIDRNMCCVCCACVFVFNRDCSQSKLLISAVNMYMNTKITTISHHLMQLYIYLWLAISILLHIYWALANVCLHYLVLVVDLIANIDEYSISISIGDDSYARAAVYISRTKRTARLSRLRSISVPVQLEWSLCFASAKRTFNSTTRSTSYEDLQKFSIISTCGHLTSFTPQPATEFHFNWPLIYTISSERYMRAWARTQLAGIYY